MGVFIRFVFVGVVLLIGCVFIFMAIWLVFGRQEDGRDSGRLVESGPWPYMDLHMAASMSESTVLERRTYALEIINAYVSRANCDARQSTRLQAILREQVFTPDWILKGESDFMRQHIWQRSHLGLCEQFAEIKVKHDADYCRNYVLEMVLREPLPCADIDVFMSDWLTLKAGDVCV